MHRFKYNDEKRKHMNSKYEREKFVILEFLERCFDSQILKLEKETSSDS